MSSLTRMKRLRGSALALKRLYYTRLWGMDIDPTAVFSMTANFDRTYPAGVHIGAETYVAFGAVILCHDRTRGLYLNTTVEEQCFIGAHSMILPGVTVGHNSVVGAGAIVTKDVPPHSAVAGNPARVIKSDIEVGPYGRFSHADDNTHRLKAEGVKP